MSTYKKIPSDLWIMSIWIVMTVMFVSIPILNNNIVRTVLGTIAVLFIPGYLLVSILFPRKNDLDIVPRIALSLGMSIVVVSMIGLILNFTIGIKFIPMLIMLCIYAIIMISGIVYRRNTLPEDERFSVSFYDTYKGIIAWLTPKDRKDGILTGILIFVIIASIGISYITIAAPKIGEKFTEFYVLNTSGKADNYQTNIKTDSPVTYLIGITNHEYVSTSYTINVVLGDEVLLSKELTLNHNETWRDGIELVPNKEGTNMRLKFLLFKGNNTTEPYRELYLRVNIAKS